MSTYTQNAGTVSINLSQFNQGFSSTAYLPTPSSPGPQYYLSSITVQGPSYTGVAPALASYSFAFNDASGSGLAYGTRYITGEGLLASGIIGGSGSLVAGGSAPRSISVFGLTWTSGQSNITIYDNSVWDVIYVWATYSEASDGYISTKYGVTGSVNLASLVTGAIPSGFTVGYPNEGSAYVSGSTAYYSPNSGFWGFDSFTYSYSFPNYGTFSGTISVTVTAPPVPKYLPTRAYLVTQKDTPVSIDLISLLANGYPLPEPIGLSATQPGRGVVNQVGNVAIYTPNTGFSGTDSFGYLYTYPEIGQYSESIYVTVKACPEPVLSLSGDSRTTSYNTPIRFSINYANTLASAAITDAPDNGSISNISIETGKIYLTYTPNVSFYGGTDTFQITGTGPCGVSSALTVTMTIGTPNAPIAGTSNITLGQDTVTAFTFPYSGVGTSLDDISGPSFGSITYTGPAFTNYSYTPNLSYVGSDYINFRAVGPGGSSNFGNVRFTVQSTYVPIRPDAISFSNLVNQSSNVQVNGSNVTMSGGFIEDYTVLLECISDSATVGASVSSLTSNYVVGFTRTRGGIPAILSNIITVQNADIIAPIIKTAQAIVGSSRLLTFRATVSGSPLYPGYSQTATFTVSTDPADTFPSAFDFYDLLNQTPSATVTTNAITLQGVTAGVPIRVALTSGSGNVVVNSVVQANITTAYAGDSIAIRTVAPSTYNTSQSYIVSIGPSGNALTDGFQVQTKLPQVVNPPWGFGNRTGMELSTTQETPNTVTFTGLDTAVVLSVNNGATIVVNGVDTTLSSATITNGQAIAISATSAGTYATTRTFTVTLTAPGVTKTDTFTYATRATVLVPTFSGNFVNQTGLELGASATSNTLTVSAFDGSLSVSVTGTAADLIINGSSVGGTSATIVSGDTVAIGATAALTYADTRSYTLTCGGVTKTWSIQTKVYDDLVLLTSF